MKDPILEALVDATHSSRAVERPQPHVNPPRCICTGVMRLVTVNHSTTTSHGRPGDTESLTTVKWNFACYDCHAHGTIVIDSGDDPMGYTEGS